MARLPEPQGQGGADDAKVALDPVWLARYCNEMPTHSCYPELFSPFPLGSIELRNRIVAPPMLQLRPLTSPEGVAWYRRLAAGGAAMVTVEVTSILDFEQQLTAENLVPLVRAIHSGGAAAGIQLFPIKFRQELDLNRLTRGQIDSIVAGYEHAARICQSAGFDAVEPHGAHGYLLNQFFMPDRNGRDDEYGGSLEKRCALGVRIVQQLRKALGENFLLMFRHTPIGNAYGIEESLVYAERLVAAGVNVLDISPAKREVEADLAAPFKANFKVPVIAVNGMEDPEKSTAALRDNRCDLVAIGRALITDAELPRKIQEGRMDEIVPCLHCDTGCFGHLRSNEPVYCEMWEEDGLIPYREGGQ